MGILSDKYRNDCIEFPNIVDLQVYRITFPCIPGAVSVIVVADGYKEGSAYTFCKCRLV